MSRMAFFTRVFARSHDAPPEAIERRPRGAGVLLNEIEPLDGDEELVVACVSQLEEFLHGVADANLLQTDERPDAVVDVNDEIADFRDRADRRETPSSPTCGARAPDALPRRRRLPRRCERRPPAAGSRARALPTATSTAAYRASSARSTGTREHVVFLEQLDRALGAARRRRDEQRRFARCPDGP